MADLVECTAFQAPSGWYYYEVESPEEGCGPFATAEELQRHAQERGLAIVGYGAAVNRDPTEVTAEELAHERALDQRCEAWLTGDESRHLRHYYSAVEPIGQRHCVELCRHSDTEADDFCAGHAEGPTYYHALERALDKAGA